MTRGNLLGHVLLGDVGTRLLHLFVGEVPLYFELIGTVFQKTMCK